MKKIDIPLKLRKKFKLKACLGNHRIKYKKSQKLKS